MPNSGRLVQSSRRREGRREPRTPMSATATDANPVAQRTRRRRAEHVSATDRFVRIINVKPDKRVASGSAMSQSTIR